MIEDGNGSKRARQRAVVGVARRLAVLLMSLWKSGQTYDPLRHSRALTTGEEVRTALAQPQDAGQPCRLDKPQHPGANRQQNDKPEHAGANRRESSQEVAA